MEKKRIIEVAGYPVEVINFGGNQSYYYPQVGDQEFEVTAKGFRQLSSFLRTLRWINRLMAPYHEDMERIQKILSP